MTAPATPGQFPDRLVIEMECGITVYPARAGTRPLAGRVVRKRPAAAVRGGNRGQTGRQAGEVAEQAPRPTGRSP